MKEVRPRVTGTEMEWPVGLRDVGASSYRQANQSELDNIVYHVEKSVRGIDEMLMNGARCYRDCDLLEYATGEEDTFIGTVAAEIAGEQLIHEGLVNCVNNHPELDSYQLLKRVYVSRNATTGYHVNLSADATKFELKENDMYDLGLWAATAAMYTGAGCIVESGMESRHRFAIAQKSTKVKAGFADGTTFEKPLICTRDEPLGDPDRFHRVQIVGMDTNMSPWATWMTIGAASLCLRAIEQSRRSSIRLLRQPTGSNLMRNEPLAQLAQNVAFNPKLTSIAEQENGKTISAIDIQRELFTLVSKTDHTDEEAEVLKNWETVLHDIDGDRSFMKSKVGWMIRQEKLAQYAQRHGLSLTDEELLSRDRMWDKVGENSIAEKLRSTLWLDDMPAAEVIKHRRDNPCPNTRAILRSAAIREAIDGDGGNASLEWSWYKLGNNAKVHINDPLITSLSEIQPVKFGYHEPEDEEEDGY